MAYETVCASLQKKRCSNVRLYPFSFPAYPAAFGAGITVRLTGEPDGEGARYRRALAEEWAQKTGNKVEYYSRPGDASAALQWWREDSPGTRSVRQKFRV